MCTTCPRRFNSANNSGTLTAATEPVTPSNTLAMSEFPMLRFDQSNEFGWQGRARHPFVSPVARPEQRPILRPLQTVRHHQVRPGLLPRALGDVAQSIVINANFELELHQYAPKAPFTTNQVDEFRCRRQSQPQFALVARHFRRAAI